MHHGTLFSPTTSVNKGKLHWDKTALEFALKIEDDSIKSYYPSLYLNIAKCYEEPEDYDNAKINYQEALLYESSLPC